jgi:hypothetical protein
MGAILLAAGATASITEGGAAPEEVGTPRKGRSVKEKGVVAIANP